MEKEVTLEELLLVYKRLVRQSDEDGLLVEGGLYMILSSIAWNDKLAMYKVNKCRAMLENQGYLVNRGGGTTKARWYIVLKGPIVEDLPKRSRGRRKPNGE